MSDATDLSAASSPAAALSDTSAQASTPIPEAITPTPGAEGAAPVTDTAPDTTSAPTTPAYDPTEVERWKTAAAEAEQLKQQIAQREQQAQEQAYQQQEQAALQQLNTWAKQTRVQARAVASTKGSDAEAEQYLDQIEDYIANTTHSYHQNIRTQREQYYQQREEARALVDYPVFLQKEFGLTDEQVEVIRQGGNAREMTLLARSHQIYNQQLERERERLRSQVATDYTTQQAEQIRQSGLTSAGGINTTLPSPDIKPGTREELRPTLARLLQRQAG